MTWALEDAPVTDPTQALVLVALADRASSDGTAAWPSQAWIAERARVSVRSVRRILAMLEAEQIITRGDQRLVSHLPGDSRPVVWDLDLNKVRDPLDRSPVTARSSTSGRSSMTEGQDVGGQRDRSPTSYKPSTQPTAEPPIPPGAARGAGASAEDKAPRRDLEAPSQSAQEIVAAWITWRGARPPGQVVGQVAKHVGVMLAEGIPDVHIRTGLAEWTSKELHPSALPSVVAGVQTRGTEAGRRTSADRGPSPTDRARDAIQMAVELQAEFDAGTLPELGAAR